MAIVYRSIELSEQMDQENGRSKKALGD